MTGEPTEPEAAAAGSTRGALAFDLVAAAVLFAAVTVGFSPWYSQRLFDRGVFEAYYGGGVYRYRVLGREAVLLLDRIVPGDPLGSHLVVNGRHPHASDLFTSVVILNGLSLLALVLLVRAVLRRTGVTEPARSLVVLTVLAIVAVSLSTVTPYDLPALALLLAVLVASRSRPPWDLLAVPLVVVGVLTRESALVAVAALAAVVITGSRPARQVRLLVAVGLAGAAAYLAVRVGSSSPSFWEELTITGNLVRLIQWFGLGVMAGAYAIWWRVAALAGLGGAAARRSVGWLWVCASPYVATALLTGYWFEIRLLVPMVVAELWVRAEASGQSQDSVSGQSSSPLDGSLTSRSRSSTVSTPAETS